MKNIILNHPLITHKLSILRDEKTGTKEFREVMSEIGEYLTYEAMRDASLEIVDVKTPIKTFKTGRLNEDNYIFVAILRAGMGLVSGVIRAVPNAKIGLVGVYRDETTFLPNDYYYNVPQDIENKEAIILDPMLATGGSAIYTIQKLKEEKVKSIKFLCVIAALEGIKKINEIYPDVEIYAASLDDGLNESKYIVPGLGDAGDRYFGTVLKKSLKK